MSELLDSVAAEQGSLPWQRHIKWFFACVNLSCVLNLLCRHSKVWLQPLPRVPTQCHHCPRGGLTSYIMGDTSHTPLLEEVKPHHEHGIALLGEYDHGVRPKWHPESLLWQFVHAMAFMLGGTTFIAGETAWFMPHGLVQAVRPLYSTL